MTVIDKFQTVGAVGQAPAARQRTQAGAKQTAFGDLLREKTQAKEQSTQTINFSKHALVRAEERGIELTPDLMDKLAGSVERAQEKGATNIVAIDATQAFIINIPYGRVITTMSTDEMKENVFTNIDGAVLL